MRALAGGAPLIRRELSDKLPVIRIDRQSSGVHHANSPAVPIRLATIVSRFRLAGATVPIALLHLGLIEGV
ncbi:MAG TPA: hypothetical protein VFW46_18455 [Stellaceae bacterium]|nr:hypothetical protein [Stellaceae bacterium]